MRIIIVPLLILVLFGCHSEADKKTTDTTQQIAETKTVSTAAIQKDTVSTPLNPDDTIPNISIPADAIQVTDDKIDTSFNIHMLWNGEGIERTPTLSKLQWKALIYKNKSFYLQDTETKLKRELYPEGTEEVGTMGLFISSIDKNATYLISGLNITNRPIDTFDVRNKFDVTNKIIYPGQKIKFDYKGTTYIFYATGSKMDSVKKGYKNYKLFLTANVKGHTFNQLISSMGSYFGSVEDGEELSYFTIEFVGDIDGDRIPDIVVTWAAEYYDSRDLYVSSLAGDKAILKHVATF